MNYAKGTGLTSRAMRSRTITLALALVSLAAVVPAAAVANGALLESSGGLLFDAESGVANSVTITGNAVAAGDTTLTITDTADVIDVDAGLEPSCTGEGTNSVELHRGLRWLDGVPRRHERHPHRHRQPRALRRSRGRKRPGERVRGSDPDGEEFRGGLGNDTINGGPGFDDIFGDEGDDTVDAGSGDDEVFDESEDGSDIYEGGAGIDKLEYRSNDEPAQAQSVDLAAGTASRAGSPESDRPTGFEDAETFGDFDSGPDSVNGTAGSNVIRTFEGNDIVNPGAGGDRSSWRRATTAPTSGTGPTTACSAGPARTPSRPTSSTSWSIAKPRLSSRCGPRTPTCGHRSAALRGCGRPTPEGLLPGLHAGGHVRRGGCA